MTVKELIDGSTPESAGKFLRLVERMLEVESRQEFLAAFGGRTLRELRAEIVKKRAARIVRARSVVAPPPELMLPGAEQPRALLSRRAAARI
jgi:hypothetical protein